MSKKLILILTVGLLIALTACQAATPTSAPPAPAETNPAPADEGPVAESASITVMTHDSFAVTKEVVEAFEAESGIKVNFVKGGDVGKALNTLILSSKTGNPPADVFYGVDNSFLSQALDNALFQPYAAPALEKVKDEFKLDPANGALPIDYGDVCINYDKAYFAEKGLALPQSLEELTDPAYKGLLVAENPATSSPGLSFLFATVARMGQEEAMAWWKAMKANGLVVVNDWETAYYTNFSGSSGKGPQPLVVSYASSPAAEFIYADPPVAESPTASIIDNGSCWRQIEFAGILKGTKNQAGAEKFIDFLYSLPFQQDMPMQMFVYPVVNGAELPADFVSQSQVPTEVSTLSPEEIAANRNAYLEAWTEIMQD